jgi:hypothetical protein
MHLCPLRAPRSLATFVLAIVIVVLPCSIATASPILLAFDVGVLQPGSPFVYDLGVAVTGGVEINKAGDTSLGELFSDDEFIDVTSNAAGTSLAYLIQGGGGDHPIASGYSTTWPLGSAILFSNFVLDQPGTLASVSVTVDQANSSPRVVGANGLSLVNGVDYFITTPFGNNLQVNFTGLGVLDQADQTPLGLMTFHLNFVADDPLPPNSVPEPASSLTLFGMAIAAMAARRRLDRQ